jgi:hypothetical protein
MLAPRLGAAVEATASSAASAPESATAAAALRCPRPRSPPTGSPARSGAQPRESSLRRRARPSGDARIRARARTRRAGGAAKPALTLKLTRGLKRTSVSMVTRSRICSSSTGPRCARQSSCRRVTCGPTTSAGARADRAGEPHRPVRRGPGRCSSSAAWTCTAEAGSRNKLHRRGTSTRVARSTARRRRSCSATRWPRRARSCSVRRRW